MNRITSATRFACGKGRERFLHQRRHSEPVRDPDLPSHRLRNWRTPMTLAKISLTPWTDQSVSGVENCGAA